MGQVLCFIDRVHDEINLENAELNKVYKIIINSLAIQLFQTENRLGRSQNHKKGITICQTKYTHNFGMFPKPSMKIIEKKIFCSLIQLNLIQKIFIETQQMQVTKRDYCTA